MWFLLSRVFRRSRVTCDNIWRALSLVIRAHAPDLVAQGLSRLKFACKIYEFITLIKWKLSKVRFSRTLPVIWFQKSSSSPSSSSPSSSPSPSSSSCSPSSYSTSCKLLNFIIIVILFKKSEILRSSSCIHIELFFKVLHYLLFVKMFCETLAISHTATFQIVDWTRFTILN